MPGKSLFPVSFVTKSGNTRTFQFVSVNKFLESQGLGKVTRPQSQVDVEGRSALH